MRLALVGVLAVAGLGLAPALGAAPSQGGVANVRLSGPPITIGRVWSFQAGESAGGGRVVYRAEGLEADKFELYSAPVDGSSPAVPLTGPPAHGGSVYHEYQISPGGGYVIYRADQDTDEVYELYSVPIDGSAAPTRLNRPLVSGGQVGSNFAVSPGGSTGGSRVVYRADQDTDEVYELYSVPIDGSATPTRLNEPLASGDWVDDLAISPDGSQVAYTVRRAATGRYELYSVPIDGSSPPTRLDVPLGDGSGVIWVLIGPGDRAVYVATYDGGSEVYSVPLDGSAAPIRISDPMPDYRGIAALEISPGEGAGDSRAVYRANPNAQDQVELFSAPLDGSLPAVKLSGPLAAGGAVDRFAISPGGTAGGVYVVYRADQELDNQYELYSVPVDGSAAPVKLNDPLAPGGSDVDAFEISADGSRVVYTAAQETFMVYEVYSVPPDRSRAPVRLNAPLSPGRRVREFKISPDGSLVAYSANQDVEDTVELYSAPIAGGAAPVKLSGAMVPGSTARTLAFSPAGAGASQVLYLADADALEVIQLYGVAADGSGAPARLNGPLALGGHVGAGFLISPASDGGGSRAVYCAEGETQGVNELYSVPLERSAAPQKLSGPLATGSDVQPRILLSPDGRRVAYAVNLDEAFGLYSAPVDGGVDPVQISGSVFFEDVEFFLISPDSSSAVFRGSAEAWERPEIYSVPLEGGSAPVQLTDLATTAGLVRADYQIGASGDVVYRGDQDTAGQVELYSVPLDGSATPVKLNGPLPGGGAVQTGFAIGASRVVYRADQDTAGQVELYSVPVNGSAAPVKLNGPLPSGGSVQYDLAIGTDSDTGASRVVYRADQDTAGRIELYSVPLDGSAVPVKLNGPLLGGGYVRAGFQVSPGGDTSGSHVIYRADQDTAGQIELYSVPLDGSAVPVKLNGPLPEGGYVLSGFRISAGGGGGSSQDAGHVVYHASQDTAGIYELYSVPLDGSAPAVKLNGPLAGNGLGLVFALSPGGSTGGSDYAVYCIDQDVPGVAELYRVPLDGSEAPLKLNRPLVEGGEVQADFRISPDGGRVLYRADQHTDQIIELYASWPASPTYLPLVFQRAAP